MPRATTAAPNSPFHLSRPLSIVKERDEALKFVTPPSDKTGGPSLAPSTDPGELKLAYAAAAAAAASKTDPNKAAAAYTACLGAFGYI